MKKKLIIILTIMFSLLLISTISFFVYVNIYYKADEEALNVLKEREDIEVNGDVTFIPSTTPSNIGFIFYPGAKVESISYFHY